MLGVVLFTLMGTERASAQHTLTLMGGSGLSTARFYPAEETKWLWGSETFGLSWRFYSDKPRFVGAVGIDLEYLERGFKVGYAYTSSFVDDKEIRTYKYYTRNVNSLMLPIVWQPHVYAAKNRIRIFIEAAFVLSFNISSDYSYQDNRFPAGKYKWKVPRDNRFGYGLSGGVGFAVRLVATAVGFGQGNVVAAEDLCGDAHGPCLLGEGAVPEANQLGGDAFVQILQQAQHMGLGAAGVAAAD